MYTNDEGDRLMGDAYGATRADRLQRARMNLGRTPIEPAPTRVQPVLVVPKERRRINWNNVAAAVIAVPLVGGLAVLIFGLLVWAATWVWSHV